MPSLAKTTSHWKLTTDSDGIAWLTIDKAGASVNSLSRGVLEELGEMLALIERTPPRALVINSAKSGFIAGADIKEIVQLETSEQAFQMIRAGQGLMDRLAALRCTTVAAVNGFALGAGSKSHWRAAIACVPTIRASRWGFRKCNLACIRGWAAPYDRCSSSGRLQPWT